MVGKPVATNSVMLRAHFDGVSIQLDEPFEIAPDTPLYVVIPQPADDEDDERAAWLLLSRQGLEAAYGDDEPEYSLDMIKKRYSE